MKLSVLRLRLKIPWDETILVRVTNLGLGFVLTTLVVAIGATNTGNNGLYVLLSLLLGILLVSGVVSRRNVDGIDVVLDGPAEVFAGEPVRFRLRLANRTLREKTALLVKVSGKAAPLLFPRLVPRGRRSAASTSCSPAGGGRRWSRFSSSAATRSASSARDASTRSTRRGSSSRDRRPLPSRPRGAGGGGRRDRSPPEGARRGDPEAPRGRPGRRPARHPLAADRATGEADRQGARLGAGARDRRPPRNGPPVPRPERSGTRPSRRRSARPPGSS